MFRIPVALTVLAVLAVFTAHAQTDRPEPVKTTTQPCGSYTLKLERNGFGDPLDRVSVIRGGTVYATVVDTMVGVDFCRDVTGDGVPEVLLAGFSGGAHCCFTHTLYALTTPPRKLLTAFSAHTDTLDVRQLDGKGPSELVGSDWRFAYAYGLSFAESAPLPVVYSYLPVPGGPPQYVENTRAFPGFLRTYVHMNSGEAFGGGVLAEYAARVIAAPSTADAYVQGLKAPQRDWLVNYGPDIRASLGDFGVYDWPARAGVAPDAPRSGLGGAFSAPGTREYLALVGQATGPTTTDTATDGGHATTSTLKLYRAQVYPAQVYRAQGSAITAGPALQTIPVKSDPSGSMDAAWWPAFAVRRAGGRDDVIVRDARSGSVRYTTHRASPTTLSALTDDPLAVAAGLLGDLSNVARQVASSYARPTPPRTTAQQAQVQQRIDAALTRAQPWAALTDTAPDLPHLGDFTVGAIEMPVDTADTARITATATVGYADGKTDSEYIFGPRSTVNIELKRGDQGWTVTKWTLTPRTGEPYPH